MSHHSGRRTLTKLRDVNKVNKANKPRDKTFLSDLQRNIYILVFLIGHEIATDTTAKTEDDVLPQNIIVIANFLGEALDECRRLLDAPWLCSSGSQRERFLENIATLRPIIASIGEIDTQNRSSLRHILSRDMRNIPLMDSDYPDDDRGAKLRLLVTQSPPPFHPQSRFAKNPWNNWLDNSASSNPGWVAIQQKIPRIGDVLNRKKVYDYDALEASLEIVSSSNLRGRGQNKIQQLIMDIQDELVTRDPDVSQICSRKSQD